MSNQNNFRVLRISKNWENLTFFLKKDSNKIVIKDLSKVYIKSNSGEFVPYFARGEVVSVQVHDHGHTLYTQTKDYFIVASLFEGRYNISVALSDIIGKMTVYISLEDVVFDDNSKT